MARICMLLVCLIVGSACGGTGSPVAPTSAPVTGAAPLPTPDVGRPEIVSFSVVGQRVLGEYRYRSALSMKAGSTDIVVTSVTFSLAGASVTGGTLLMTRPVAATASFEFGTPGHPIEFVGSGAVAQAVVTVGYTNRDGQIQQVTSVAEVPPMPSDAVKGSLAITRFTVDQWSEAGGYYAYWPRLTLREVTGASDVKVTRVQFTLLDIGAHGRVPPHSGEWMVAAGASRDLFHEVAYGEPRFYLSSSQLTGRVEVLLSYIDDSGRSADASAIATVQPSRPPS